MARTHRIGELRAGCARARVHGRVLELARAGGLVAGVVEEAGDERVPDGGGQCADVSEAGVLGRQGRGRTLDGRRLPHKLPEPRATTRGCVLASTAGAPGHHHGSAPALTGVAGADPCVPQYQHLGAVEGSLTIWIRILHFILFSANMKAKVPASTPAATGLHSLKNESKTVISRHAVS